MFGQKKPKFYYYPHPPLENSKLYRLGVHQGGGPTGIRNQPYFNPYISNSNWNNQSWMQLGGDFPYGGPIFNENSPPGNGWNPYMEYGNTYQGDQPYPVESILQNPLQPKKNHGQGGGGNPYMSNMYPYMHPYPKPGMGNRPPSGVNSVINSFKTQDGSFDFNKMVDTAGQMMNAFSQVSGLVKGLGGIFKV